MQTRRSTRLGGESKSNSKIEEPEPTVPEVPMLEVPVVVINPKPDDENVGEILLNEPAQGHGPEQEQRPVGPSQTSTPLQWCDMLHPLTHDPQCTFKDQEAVFCEDMLKNFLTPAKLEEELAKDADQHLRVETAMKGKSRKEPPPLFKRPVHDIANEPFVVKYLMEQREMVTTYREKFYNHCDCKFEDKENVNCLELFGEISDSESDSVMVTSQNSLTLSGDGDK